MYYYSKEKLGAEEWVLMLSFDMSIYKHTQMGIRVAHAGHLGRHTETVNDAYILQGVGGLIYEVDLPFIF